MLKKLCKSPCCTHYRIEGSSYCEKHQYLQIELDKKREEWLKQRFANQKPTEWRDLYNSTKWRELRKRKLSEYPYCEKCSSTDNLEIHHKIAHKGNEELFYDYSNLQTLCKKCHSSETAKDQIKQLNRRLY